MDLVVMTDVTCLGESLGTVWLSVPLGLTPLMLLCVLLLNFHSSQKFLGLSLKSYLFTYFNFALFTIRKGQEKYFLMQRACSTKGNHLS